MHDVVLDLCLWGFEDMVPEDISGMLNLEPVKVYRKGEKVSPHLALLAKENGWRMTAPADKSAPFEQKLNALLDVIEQRFETFQFLCQKYHCELSCAVYLSMSSNESMPWIHFGKRFMDINRQLNIEIDLDFYRLT